MGLDGIQYVMILGIFAFLICTNDLYRSLDCMESKQQKKMLTIAFIVLFILYVCEMFLTMGSVVTAICDVALDLIGFTHYSIKLIVSFLYTKRVELALLMQKKGVMQRNLKILQFIIIFTYVSQILKVIIFYDSHWEGDVCVYDLGGFWAWLDEIMFGCIDLLTLGVFFHFYYFNKDKLNEKTAGTILRILVLSGITAFATVFAIFMNNVDPPNGLTASVIDITTDVISLQKTYTRRTLPPDAQKSKPTSSASVAPSAKVAASSVAEHDDLP